MLFRILKFLLYFIFLVNGILLIVCLNAQYVNPLVNWLPSAIVLFFKYFAALNIFCLILFWVAKNKPLAIIAALLLIYSLMGLVKVLAFHPFAAKSKNSLKLMTYNVEGFEWFENASDLHKILSVIRNENPAILCLEEYYLQEKNRKLAFDTFTKIYGYKYYKEYIVQSAPPDHKFGLAIFSHYPFTNFTPIPYGIMRTSNGAYYVDVKYKSCIFRLFNIHLQSASLKEREYELPTSQKDFTAFRFDLFKMGVTKLREAFRKRSLQADDIEDSIEKSPYKVVVCGDFNDLALSYAYSKLTTKLDDAYLKAGFGLGSTYAGKIPFLRIDHILADPSMKIEKTYVVKKTGSDHYPLVSYIDPCE